MQWSAPISLHGLRPSVWLRRTATALSSAMRLKPRPASSTAPALSSAIYGTWTALPGSAQTGPTLWSLERPAAASGSAPPDSGPSAEATPSATSTCLRPPSTRTLSVLEMAYSQLLSLERSLLSLQGTAEVTGSTELHSGLGRVTDSVCSSILGLDSLVAHCRSAQSRSGSSASASMRSD